MSTYNLINYDSNIKVDNRCLYDSNIGYTSDFTIDGDVDGWELFDGIHTYSAWSGFLFGTLYTSYAMIGRNSNIFPIDGEVYYIFVINMLIKPVDRNNEQQDIPNKAKVMWTTFTDNSWDDRKSKEVDISADGKWHTYSVNMAEEQYWVGSISNLRIYPVYNNGMDGDEFVIKRIQIKSVDHYRCNRVGCSYYSKYKHPCGGIGKRSSCESNFTDKKVFNIQENVNNEFIVNINGYGYEHIKIPNNENITHQQLANELIKSIGNINIGGYAECEVEYTEYDTFIIYSGTYSYDSSIELSYSKLAEEMGFFDELERPIYSYDVGEDPATNYVPYSSYLITHNQLLNMFDNNLNTYLLYNPNIYNIEAGREDWLRSGLRGHPNFYNTTNEFMDSGDMKMEMDYKKINGINTTIIDINHPFNASGRIKHIDIMGTVDYGYKRVKMPDGSIIDGRRYNAGRLYAKGAKVKIFRPRKDGSLHVVHELDIEDRKNPERSENNLIEKNQFHTHVDCDIFVNKGDLLGVYNISLYYNKSTDEKEDGTIDASYYYIFGDTTIGDTFFPRKAEGTGAAGLLIYARSDITQNRLLAYLNLNNRVNIEKLYINGYVENNEIDFNIMRCRDINWNVDLFNETHKVGYYAPIENPWSPWFIYTIPNKYYGEDNLSNGVRTIYNALASEGGFSVDHEEGVIPVEPTYFWVNGDHQWDIAYHWPEWYRSQHTVWDFEEDPIEFTVVFPHGKPKKIHRSVIYFKDSYNFRNFFLATYLGPNNTVGDTYDPFFKYIPEYKSVTLDGFEYSDDIGNKSFVEDYLFSNPSIAKPEVIWDGSFMQGFMPGQASIPPHWTYGGQQSEGKEWDYYMSGRIDNHATFIQGAYLNWNVLDHKWEPIDAYGFRLFTDFHKSTGIIEMELYGYIESFNADMSSSLFITSSFYGDYWFDHTIKQESDKEASCYINNSVRHIYFEFEPNDTIFIHGVTASVTDDYVYFGDKGCDDYIYLKNNSLDKINTAQVVKIKNIYGGNYNLFVDIPEDPGYNDRIIYYNKLTDINSLAMPTLGPGSILNKKIDYPLLNNDNNVSINCDSYGLVNSSLGSLAYYSYNNMETWEVYNESNVIDTDYINFHNLPKHSYSVAHIIGNSRNRYWRLKATSYYNNIKIYEIKVYRNNEELSCVFYHNKVGEVYSGGLGKIAYHLNNNSVTGSYYRLTEDQYITIDLGEINYIDKIVIYHETIKPYTNVSEETPHFFCGVDRNTYLYIEDSNFDNYIEDHSYYEHNIFNKESVSLHTFDQVINYIDNTYDFENDLLAYSEWVLHDPTHDKMYAEYITSSGTTVSGVYEYPGYIDFDFMTSRTSSYRGLYTDLSKEDISFYSYNGFTNPSFNIKCKIEFYHDIINENDSVGIGLTESRTTVEHYSYLYRHVLNGAQIAFDKDGINIAVKSAGSSDNIDTKYLNVPVTSGTVYCCDFTFDGEKTYNLKVYENNWLEENKLDEGMLESTNWWESDRFTFAMLDGPAQISGERWEEDHRIKGKLYYIELNGENIQTGQLETWAESIKFSGSNTSYLRIPYHDSFNIDNAKFSFDFFIKPDKLPLSVCNIIDEKIKVCPHDIYTNEDGKFGWQAEFDSGSYIRFLNNEDHNIADNDFCFDFLYTFTQINDKNIFIYRQHSYSFYFVTGTNKLVFEGYNGDVIDESLTIEAQWSPEQFQRYHIAVTRNNDIVNIFVDGVLLNSKYITGSYRFPYDLDSTSDYSLYIGGDFNRKLSTYSLSGFIEEFRYTIGHHRWAQNFDVSTVPYNIDEYTKILLRFDDKYYNIIENYDYSWNALPENRGFILRMFQQDKTYWFELVYNLGSCIWEVPTYMTTFKDNLWYHIFVGNAYSTGTYERQRENIFYLSINSKHFLESTHTTVSPGSLVFRPGNQDIIIGRRFKGNIKYFRYSKTNTNLSNDWEGVRLMNSTTYPIPFYGYSKLYEVSLYSSYDSSFYNKIYDLDFMMNNSYNHYNISNLFSSYYNSFFVIDLGKRYDLSIIRSYGSEDAHIFNILTNTLYSDLDTHNVGDAFYTFDPTEYFQEYDRTLPKNYLVNVSKNNIVYHLDNSLYFGIATGQTETTHAIATSNYFILNNFDIQYRYIIYKDSNSPWAFRFILQNINNSDQNIIIERGFIDGNSVYKIKYKDKFYTSYNTVYYKGSFSITEDIRVVKEGFLIKIYKKQPIANIWDMICSFSLSVDFWEYNRVTFELESFDPMCPQVEVGLDNFIVNYGRVFYDNHTDARWVAIALLNGDGVERFINKLGIYTNIQRTIAPPGGYYNNTWDHIGRSLTSYRTINNLALGADVEVSSYVGSLVPEKVVDGVRTFSENNIWGSAEERNPFIIIDLGEVFSVNKVVVYQGIYNSTEYLIRNYDLSFSEDGVNYEVVSSISDNGSMDITHNIHPSLNTRYIKVYVNSYSSTSMYFEDDKNAAAYYFRGVAIREIEVFEDTGDFSIISSEEYPIIATNLYDHFYLSSIKYIEFRVHSSRSTTSSYIPIGYDKDLYDMVTEGDRVILSEGDYEEEVTISSKNYDINLGGYILKVTPLLSETYSANTILLLKKQSYVAESVDDLGYSTNWSTSRDALCYSDSPLNDIRKVTFNEFGSTEGYNRWVVLKKDSATAYNNGPHYFRRLKITSADRENPVNNWWWWVSSHSSLSNSIIYTPLVSDKLLRIHYSNNTVLDDIYMYEISNFGTDSDWSWRDGLCFILHIHNIDNIDASEGCIYVGGYDFSEYKNSVVYEWSMSDLFTALKEGSNMLFLKFKDATKLIYNDIDDETVGITFTDTCIDSILLQKIGLKIKGTGEGDFDLFIDGFFIGRNLFQSRIYTKHSSNKGLYLTGSDSLTLPVSNLSLSSGFISFWMSPDYDGTSMGINGRRKVRNIVSINNVHNDFFGCFVAGNFIEIYFGNITDGGLRNYRIDPSLIGNINLFDAGDTFHFAIVFSNNGKNIDSDSSTVKVYINNNNIFSLYNAWEWNEYKHLNVGIGGAPPHQAIFHTGLPPSSIDAVIGNLKIGNFCKTDFSVEMSQGFDFNNASIFNSNELIEISKDNVTFYKAGDINLPFSFNQVPHGEEIPIYIRSNLENLSEDNLKYRLGNLIVQWELPT